MKKFQVKYGGSYFWLVFWVLLFFPVAIALLVTRINVVCKDTLYVTSYDGSRFWLCFWTLLFFPIAIILVITNGLSVREEIIRCSRCSANA